MIDCVICRVYNVIYKIILCLDLHMCKAVKVSDFIRIIGFYVDTAFTRTDLFFITHN